MENKYVFDSFSLKHSDVPTAVYPHTHSMYEITYCVHGNLDIRSGFRSTRGRDGCFILISPGTIHNMYVDEKTRYERYVLFLTADILPQPLREDLLGAFALNRNVFTDKDNVLLHQLKQMEEMLQSDTEHKRELMEQRISVLLSDICLITASKKPKKTDMELSPEKQVILILREHLFEPHTLKTLAAMLNINPAKLDKLFKKRWNMTVNDYIKISRLVYTQMLIENGMPKTTAAIRTGYHDYSTYYRTYEKSKEQFPELQEKLQLIQNSFSDGEMEKWMYIPNPRFES